jgi:serine/threonine protein kinase
MVKRIHLEGKVIKDYTILEWIGGGGQADVYTCLYLPLGQKRAIKILNPFLLEEQYIERFRDREVRAQASLQHENVVSVIEWIEDEQNGIYGIVMEYVPGKDLKKTIETNGALSVQASLSICIKTGKALSFAHKHGITHRDVKSSNILIKDRNTVKLTDFGIAIMADASKRITKTRLTMGTIEYMSPEQIRGETIDCRTDIYSLGIVLYEMLTGNVPFTGDTEYIIIEKQLKERPKSLKTINRKIPDRLEQILFRCLEKDKEKRYPSTEILVHELSDLFVPEIEKDYEEGVFYFNNREYEKALNRFDRVLRIEECYENVQKYIADCRNKLSKKRTYSQTISNSGNSTPEDNRTAVIDQTIVVDALKTKRTRVTKRNLWLSGILLISVSLLIFFLSEQGTKFAKKAKENLQIFMSKFQHNEEVPPSAGIPSPPSRVDYQRQETQIMPVTPPLKNNIIINKKETGRHRNTSIPPGLQEKFKEIDRNLQ